MKDLCSKNYARKSLICPNVAILRKDTGGVADPVPFYPWIRDPEQVFSGSRISDPKPIFLRAQLHFFGVKVQ
jgi:hypothetical protein